MKKYIVICAALVAVLAAVVYAAQDTDISNREVRDPKKLEAWLEANAQDAETRIAADEAVGVTNVVPVTGAVTATGTVSLVYQYVTLTNVFNDVTNTFLACTNVPTATTTINVLNGGAVMTNITIQR